MWKELGPDGCNDGAAPRWTDGEHPQVVMADALAHPLPGHVIAFANEKGGVGKSTLAFHTAVALARAGHRVVAIDLDRRQSTLESSFAAREGTARVVGVDLPMPMHAVLNRHCAAQLQQEVARLDARADYVVLDAPGADCPIFRRAVALAHTLVTPINPSFVDLQVIGRIDPVSGRPGPASAFGRTVAALREERRGRELAPLDWIVAKNRVRSCERRQIDRIDSALSALAGHHEFRVACGLSERVAFRELFQFGLTHLDLPQLPDMTRASRTTTAEIEELIDDLLGADRRGPGRSRRAAATPVRTSGRARAAYREALAAATGAVSPCA
ncbi:division plane positioning ATPase MipZ [Pelagerythrobacter marinus]|uniref:division plane positioning ATPase MipZ n=1 Tax=Pelagerythrobacter marinus TaxID=538382 RepID=UPI0020369C22|nr:division plane positioning ATPase MipZ [Pelagerythrobacter marinus]USA40336.1 division plane positioning ATPase MipZ [Pelagerythrobacter marinus]WPZ05540.1 division plane positioning ATPase MipZ [Pelagerythrobacter marinus]